MNETDRDEIEFLRLHAQKTEAEIRGLKARVAFLETLASVTKIMPTQDPDFAVLPGDGCL